LERRLKVGAPNSAPSPVDKIPLCDDPPSFIKIIAAIRASKAAAASSPSRMAAAYTYMRKREAKLLKVFLGREARLIVQLFQ
jgi:hypothetical protein